MVEKKYRYSAIVNVIYVVSLLSLNLSVLICFDVMFINFYLLEIIYTDRLVTQLFLGRINFTPLNVQKRNIERNSPGPYLFLY